jgi:hypothetical protein
MMETILTNTSLMSAGTDVRNIDCEYAVRILVKVRKKENGNM